jgi:hypothetical protein
MTSPQRMKDLADVMELVKLLDLSGEFSRQLAPFVREKYLEIWQSARPGVKRYLRLWSSKSLSSDAAELLDRMRADGVTVEPRGGGGDDVYLATSDPAVARKYDMHEESEFWGDDQDDEPPLENSNSTT